MIDNGTGAPAGWNWILCFLFTAGTLTGFDASGHIAEETKNASVVAARGILSGAVATGILSFATIILYLFSTPPIDVWFTLTAPQPFVQIYALALGKGGAIVMTIVGVVGLVLVRRVRFCDSVGHINQAIPPIAEHKCLHRGSVSSDFCHRQRRCPSRVAVDCPS